MKAIAANNAYTQV